VFCLVVITIIRFVPIVFGRLRFEKGQEMFGPLFKA